MVKWKTSGTKQLAAKANFPRNLRNGLKGGLTQWNRSGSGLRYAAPTYTSGWQVYAFRASHSYSQLMGVSPGVALTNVSRGRHTGGALILSNRFTWVNGSQNINAKRADVQTVVVHEVGHFTGLAHPWPDHCSDHTPYTAAEKKSVMTTIITGTRRKLNSDDVAGVKALY
ncbi:matrixin family metalloprotease [Streptomyces spiramyceticus]|uniref:matrixin family metalloprotease n=1 Tax=Streptomyces spiramyceticus TaxID=299717 RepID=UPI00237A1EED|nr:matrixin family metalloprotease [Streptomyces spiramyceticus]